MRILAETDEDLGRNFRQIATTILNRYIAPHRDDLVRLFGELRHKSSMIIVSELEGALTRPKAASDINQPGRSRYLSVFNSRKSPPQPLETIAERDQRIVSEWRKKSKQSDNRLTTRCFAALHRVATAIISKHGHLLGDNALLEDLALTLVCNDFGSEVIGQAILTFIQKAVACEGYRFLSRQEKPS